MSGKTKTILDKFGTFRLTERGYVEMKVKLILKSLRPLSVYSMGDESSHEMKLSLTGLKNFLRHAERRVYFFPHW